MIVFRARTVTNIIPPAVKNIPLRITSRARVKIRTTSNSSPVSLRGHERLRGVISLQKFIFWRDSTLHNSIFMERKQGSSSGLFYFDAGYDFRVFWMQF